jgi:hypothetical protein
MEFIILFVIICILGALTGATSFGETIKEGCGCLLIIIIAIGILIYYFAHK